MATLPRYPRESARLPKLENSPSLGLRKHTDRLPYGTALKQQLVAYMKEKGLHILAFQETRAPGTTQFVSNGYMFMLVASGASKEYAG
eukprot:5348990-Alexandrium_andersonii.AAC.1